MKNQYEGVVYGLLPEEEKERLKNSGKKIQIFIDGGNWISTLTRPYWNFGTAYREKPEPKNKLVPWEMEDIKSSVRICYKDSREGWKLITGCEKYCVSLPGGTASYAALLNAYVQYPSGDPCGKLIEDE